MSETSIFIGKIKEVLPEGPENHASVRINFEDGSYGLLDGSTRQSGIWKTIISILLRSGRPVYSEIDGDTAAIRQLCFPFETKVLDIIPGDDGAKISFTRSDSWHYVSEVQLLAALQLAKETSATILVASTLHGNQIIDVRSAPATIEQPEEPELVAHGLPYTPVSHERARELFAMMAVQNCTRDNIDTYCIPFSYPSSVCWVRAHKMCYMMVDEGLTPSKVWITGRNLRVNTNYDRKCYVTWPWHVAPTLMVTQPDGHAVKMVFDPALFDEPVTPDEWKRKISDPEAEMTHLGWKGYGFKGAGRASREQMEADLAYHCSILKIIWEEDGYPPYPCPKA